jgi:cell division protein YceG involved in septum cleavage
MYFPSVSERISSSFKISKVVSSTCTYFTRVRRGYECYALDARTHRAPKKIINKSAIANIIRSNWTAEVAISSNKTHPHWKEGATHAKKKISTTEMIDNLKYVKSEYVVAGMHT